MNVPDRIGSALGAGERCLVRCLGRFGIEDFAGNALHIRSRKARALVAALALSGRGLSRDKIADLLWSDRGQAQARSSVRQAIFEIQHSGAGAELLVVGRDELAVSRPLLVTDIELIRAAAEANDWALLAALLAKCDEGLLTDLDGLDGEFDMWLRTARAGEPSATIAAALDAADDCAGESPRAAMAIVAEVLRIDPANERAVRTAMQVDHELGDAGAVRRHYEALKDHLRADYDAEPSEETADLFHRLTRSNGNALSGLVEPFAPPKRLQQTIRASRGGGWVLGIGALAALALAIALLIGLTRPKTPPADSSPVLVAVLPFEQHGNGDAFLAEGLWDDTRSALARNAALRVLGRATTTAAVQHKLSPDQYRRRFGVAYLLEGVVRRSGERTLVSVSLTRTSDGLAIWEDNFPVAAGEPFALQAAIADGIAGKLRARVAPGGGRRAEQIATSAEVYGLYSQARTLLRRRDPEQISRASALLRRATAADPNYAPAWSSLAAALYLERPGVSGQAERNREARAAARRAIALAPNLAEAHATLALIDGDNSPDSEAPLRHAVALDPSYAEAWTWLGNALASQSRDREAEQAYRRAVELDPLWFVPAQNLVSVAIDGGDRAAIGALFAKLTTAGADADLLSMLRAQERMGASDYSEAVRLLTAVRDRTGAGYLSLWCEVLTRLGYPDAAMRFGAPSWYGPVVRSERTPPTVVNGRPVSPADFWQAPLLPSISGRAMVNRGRGAELVRLYRAQFGTADAFIAGVRPSVSLPYLAPTLAIALRSVGSREEADEILAAAAADAGAKLRRAPASGELHAVLAYVRAAQGRNEEALQLLAQAEDRGWLPDGSEQALDLDQEPAFSMLRRDARLRVLRQRILDHIARERSELGPLRT